MSKDTAAQSTSRKKSKTLAPAKIFSQPVIAITSRTIPIPKDKMAPKRNEMK